MKNTIVLAMNIDKLDDDISMKQLINNNQNNLNPEVIKFNPAIRSCSDLTFGMKRWHFIISGLRESESSLGIFRDNNGCIMSIRELVMDRIGAQYYSGNDYLYLDGTYRPKFFIP